MRIKIDTAARSPEELLERWKSQEELERTECNDMHQSKDFTEAALFQKWAMRSRLAKCIQELQACLTTK